MISLSFDEISEIKMNDIYFDFKPSDFDLEIMDDSYLYCYGCKSDNKRCDKHAINWVYNKPIYCSFNKNSDYNFHKYLKKNKKINLCTCENNEIAHLKNSLPDMLALGQSFLYPSEIGIWSLELIEKGTIFGPFLGKILEIGDISDNVYERSINGCAWVVWKSTNRQVNSIIDAEDSFSSNWMRCVKSCHEIEKQNLLAIQHDGFIFYRACQDILPNRELLVYYEIQHEKDVEIAKAELGTNSKLPQDFFQHVPIQSNEKPPDVERANIARMEESRKSPIKLFPSSERIKTVETSSTPNRSFADSSLQITSDFSNNEISNLSVSLTSQYTPVSSPAFMNFISIPAISSFIKPLVHSDNSTILSARNHQTSTPISLVRNIYNVPSISINSPVIIPRVTSSNKVLSVNETSDLSIYPISDFTSTGSSNTVDYCYYQYYPQLPYISNVYSINPPQSHRFDNPTNSNNQYVPSSFYDSFHQKSSIIQSSTPTNNVTSTTSLGNNPQTTYPSTNKENYSPIISISKQSPFDNLWIDDETKRFIVALCKVKPYLCVENIEHYLIENFPDKKSLKCPDFLDLLRRKICRVQTGKSIQYDEDLISAVVKLYQINSKLSVEDIYQELIRLFPQKLPMDVITICNVIKSNFPPKKNTLIDKDIVLFVDKYVKKNPHATSGEICLKLQHSFPEGKGINSALYVNKILHDTEKRTEKQTVDVIDVQVRKIVHQICKNYKENANI